MTEHAFVDYYETLQVSQNADTETIERVYRLLAKRYHPDNGVSGNVDKFTEVQGAYEVLSHPERRAEYDDTEKSLQWEIFGDGAGAATDSRDQDQRIFHGILSLLYVARRRDPTDGGLGAVRLEKMLGTPREHLEFPLGYLRRRKLIETLANVLMAITADGTDKIGSKELALPSDRLLTASSVAEAQDSAATDPVSRLSDGSPGTGNTLTHPKATTPIKS